MLPRPYRLVTAKDFKRVYQKGSFFTLGPLSVSYIPNKTSVSRLGFVVSKKVTPKATNRNKIKRKFREAARILYAELPKGYDVVVTVKKGAEEADFEAAQKTIKETFKKIR